MDSFNVIAGLVSIGSLFFSLWLYMLDRGARAVEAGKAAAMQSRLADMLALTNSTAKQLALIIALADRDEVTKKELKHLAVALSASIASQQDSLERLDSVQRSWRYANPGNYLPQVTEPQSPAPVGESST